MKPINSFLNLRFVWVWWALASGTLGTPVSAQIYNAGDIVQDFTLANRLSSAPIRLSDYAGKIIFLEWFAWW